MKGFVKSGGTSTPVSHSRAELERLLTRYGCSAFGTTIDYDSGMIRIHFIVPDDLKKDAPKIPVRLEVFTRDVYDALYGRPIYREWDAKLQRYTDHHNLKGYDSKKLAQADRVAWRHLILWVDAALSAASAGVQKISEAFLAHTLVQNPDGGPAMRLVEQMDRQAGGNWRALLSSGKEDK